jgi:hypothetical protein
MGEIIATLGVNSALTPEDVEITPGTEDIVVEPSEGCFLRTVTVKAIPADDGGSGDDTGNDTGDNTGNDTGDTGDNGNG